MIEMFCCHCNKPAYSATNLSNWTCPYCKKVNPGEDQQASHSNHENNDVVSTSDHSVEQDEDKNNGQDA